MYKKEVMYSTRWKLLRLKRTSSSNLTSIAEGGRLEVSGPSIADGGRLDVTRPPIIRTGLPNGVPLWPTAGPQADIVMGLGRPGM